MNCTGVKSGNTELLFFIIIYLLLFYDGSFINYYKPYHGNSSVLYFILVFLLLFY